MNHTVRPAISAFHEASEPNSFTDKRKTHATRPEPDRNPGAWPGKVAVAYIHAAHDGFPERISHCSNRLDASGKSGAFVSLQEQ